MRKILPEPSIYKTQISKRDTFCTSESVASLAETKTNLFFFFFFLCLSSFSAMEVSLSFFLLSPKAPRAFFPVRCLHTHIPTQWAGYQLEKRSRNPRGIDKVPFGKEKPLIQECKI